MSAQRQAVPPAPFVAIDNAIAIASGKGGVGKTCLSIALCHALAKRERRCLLFDGDLGLANIDIQLGLSFERNLAGVLNERYAMERAINHFAPGAFDVVAGESGSGALSSLTGAQLHRVIAGLKEVAPSYQNLVLDLGAGIERSVRLLSQAAPIKLIVTTDEPTSLTDSYALMKLCHAADAPNDFRIIVNMASSRRDGEMTYRTLLRACETFLKFRPRLAGIVRRDPHVREAIRAQSPLLTRFPNSDAARDVDEIAERLLSEAPH